MDKIGKIAHNRVDHTGKKFGKLTVISYKNTINKRSWWNCICDCGNPKVVNGHELACGDTKSCGCLRGKSGITHGEAHKTKENRTWQGIRTRCNNKNHHKYPIYGGRGITICERWNKYENFLADMGRAPSPEHSIERDDVDGNYEPSNCRWATAMEQANNKQNSIFATAYGKTQTISMWARELKVSEFTLYRRIKAGWSPEKTITTPIRKIKVSTDRVY